MSDGSSVWVQSTLNEKTRSYAVELVLADGTARIMGRLEAVEYAAALYAVAARAEYDAAVRRQLTARGHSEAAATHVMLDVRDARTPIRQSHTEPVAYTPGVSAFDGRPFVRADPSTGEPWQWSPDEVRQHAGHVMDVAAGVEYDTGYVHVLTDVVGIPFPSATAFVNDLANHRTTEGDQS